MIEIICKKDWKCFKSNEKYKFDKIYIEAIHHLYYSYFDIDGNMLYISDENIKKKFYFNIKEERLTKLRKLKNKTIIQKIKNYFYERREAHKKT